MENTDIITKKKAIEDFEVSDAYQILSKRYNEEIDSLKPAYKVKGDEAAQLNGYYQGLSFFFNLIDAFKREGEAAQEKIDANEFRKIKNTEEPKEI